MSNQLAWVNQVRQTLKIIRIKERDDQRMKLLKETIFVAVGSLIWVMLPYTHMQRPNMKVFFQKAQLLYIRKNKDDQKRMIMVKILATLSCKTLMTLSRTLLVIWSSFQELFKWKRLHKKSYCVICQEIFLLMILN